MSDVRIENKKLRANNGLILGGVVCSFLLIFFAFHMNEIVAIVMAFFLFCFIVIEAIWLFYSNRIRGHWVVFSDNKIQYRTLLAHGELLYDDIATFEIERFGRGHLLIIWPKKSKIGIKFKDATDFLPKQIDELFQELKERVPEQNKVK